MREGAENSLSWNARRPLRLPVAHPLAMREAGRIDEPIDFSLTEEQRAFQATARQFARDEMMPHVRDWDEQEIFPAQALRAAANLGFAGIYVRDDVGGSALNRLDAALIFEELAQGCTSTAAYISIHNMVAWMIDRFGGDEQRQRFLPKLCTMEHFASYCLPEPGSGSDAARLTTRARRVGDHYVLGGAQFCLDRTVEYMKERKQFGTRLADFQALQFRMADYATEIDAARLLLHRAAHAVSDGEPGATQLAAKAKRLATDTGFDVVNGCLQMHGGYGYLRDHPIERVLRDVRVHQLLEGTNEIMRVIIARAMLSNRAAWRNSAPTRFFSNVAARPGSSRSTGRRRSTPLRTAWSGRSPRSSNKGPMPP